VKWFIAVIVAVSLGCQSSEVELNPLDVTSATMQSRATVTVVVAARVDDFLSCNLYDGFAALRQLQWQADRLSVPEVVVVAVTGDARDTLTIRGALSRERIAAPIRVVSPHDAGRFLDENMLPAIYLIQGQRVVRQWKSTTDRGPIVIGRREVADAVTGHRQSPDKK
jgi:hypothetical protein